jgi:hypothetical protein
MGDFSLSMDELLKQVDRNVNAIIKKTVFDLQSTIIKDSPVDSGRFRANWQVSFNEPINSEVDTIDKSKLGRDTYNKNGFLINNSKVPLTYWIQNNLPYSEKLEFGLFTTKPETIKTIGGFSKQAPMGFTRVNVARFNEFFEKNVRKYNK